MPDKKDNRKMVDMLERMGMIKKADDLGFEIDQSVFDANTDAAAPPVSEAPAFTGPESFAEPARQAIPVVPPVAPPVFTAPVEPVVSEMPKIPEPIYVAPEPPMPPAETVMAPFPAYGPTLGTPYISPEMEKNMYSHLSVSTTFNFDKKSAPETSSLSDSFWDEKPAELDPSDKFLEIFELYQHFHMKTEGVDTVYLIEEYIKTLPDSLPAELRRSIIMRIVQASGFDFDRLLSDGIDRVSKLNDYAALFASRTDEIVTSQNNTIAELERQIELVRASINERKNLHKKQFLVIENEAQRLKDILDFITK